MTSLGKFRPKMRPWGALVAAYALAFQAILSAFAGPADAVAASSLDDTLVICHNNGGTDGASDDGTSQKPDQHSHCLACCLARAWSPAIEPLTDVIASLDAELFAILAPRQHHQVVGYVPPPDRQQRGPPAASLRVG